jgi:hypothetical protein
LPGSIAAEASSLLASQSGDGSPQSESTRRTTEKGDASTTAQTIHGPLQAVNRPCRVEADKAPHDLRKSLISPIALALAARRITIRRLPSPA